MKKITLYHNSYCSKSRAALEILEKEKMEFEVVEYLLAPPSDAILDQLLIRLALGPEEIIRKSEDTYEELRLAGQLPKDRAAWIRLMVEYPILIERPILCDGETAVLGRPSEKVSHWLKLKREG